MPSDLQVVGASHILREYSIRRFNQALSFFAQALVEVHVVAVRHKTSSVREDCPGDHLLGK